jgi:hypothetical protein
MSIDREITTSIPFIKTGSPISSSNNTSSDTSSDAPSSDSKEETSEVYPPFLHLHPKHVEFTALFPEFPKSDKKRLCYGRTSP